MMDRYTLMCSKLTQLQEEWEPETGDWVYRKDKKEKFCLYYNEEHGAPPRKYIDPYTAIYLPSLEDSIGMLEDILWTISKIPGEYIALNRLDLKAHGNLSPRTYFTGKNPQEALLKLLAYERWNLLWSNEKETWEEG
jgi:hypothetical protein